MVLVYQRCRGTVPINATLTPRRASERAKLAATVSWIEPVGELTIKAFGRLSVDTLVAASERNAASHDDPGGA